MARNMQSKYLVNFGLPSHPDCKYCERLHAELDKACVREMNLRVELGEAKRARTIKGQYANRTRW